MSLGTGRGRRWTWFLFAAALLGCSSPAASPPLEDGGAGVEDGGGAGEDGSAGTEVDGGAAADGGLGADGGGRVDGGGTDGGRGDGGPLDGGRADGGAAVDGGPQVGCTPYVPRPRVPTLLIGPTGLESALLAQVRSATRELAVMIYELDVQSFVDAFIALQRSGVSVRVLLDGRQAGNAAARQQLMAAGVAVQDAPASFSNAHSKVLVIDRVKAVVMSANLNGYSMQSERNYGVVLEDAEDVADLQALFETDWNATGITDLACTRLIVSPNNSRDRLTAFISGAQRTLDLAVMYVTDTSIVAAIRGRKQAGVAVRVLLADPAWITSNSGTAAALADGGIPVKYFKALELHAKLVVADGVAFVGSENFSATSLNRNREVGVLVTEAQPAGQAAAQFVSDWGRGVSP